MNESPPIKAVATGAAPSGASDEKSAAIAVQHMFNEIAGRYDLLNHVLSANVDRLWWRRTARKFRHILSRPDAAVLDLCCGTGDMALALRRQAPANAQPYVGADFSHQMLRRGSDKFKGRGIVAIEADALQLPFPDGSFDLVVSAFGFRNLANYDAGLREIHRVLRPGGEFGILDFAEPGGLFGKVYTFYFRNVLPKIGGLISGASGAYEYLPASVKRFPAPQQMQDEMRDVGFTEVSWTRYTFGIAGLYRGRKATSKS
ncbi:MAG: Ubiquinone/menaquinone biosynthesis methyltransferase UbiE [Acidobacteriales bacterium]|nr:Ubiquinone/menaquinone biosynthesis methyltransferase UbiE [Terriglobales bacterium]